MVTYSDLNIKKPKILESRRIQLISPILHIGSEVQKINKFEYVQTDDKIYIPNQEALAKALKRRGDSFLNKYIQIIKERGDITILLNEAFPSGWLNEKDADGNLIFPRTGISCNWAGELTDLRPMIRNGMGHRYIPGSSIKGAIRTAIAYHLIKHADKHQVPSSKQVSEIEKTLRQKLKLGQLNQYQQKSLDDELFMNSLFSEFNLTHQERIFLAKGANSDFLRVLKITDTKPLLESKIITEKGQEIPINIAVVAEVLVSSRFLDYLAKYKVSIYAEMVRNIQTEFILTLDTEMLSWFKHKQGMKLPFSNLDELLQICREFTQEQWDYEHDYWQNIKNNPRALDKNLDFNDIRKFYEIEKCPYDLRLGWGSGMTGTTVGLCFDDELRADLRDTCGNRRPGFEAPKSRRTIVGLNNEIKFVPGWVKFKTGQVLC